MSETLYPSGGGARLPSRAEVRRVVADNHAELRRVAQAGGNPHQVSLDQMDKVRTYAALLNTEDATAFLTMYAEESKASSAATITATKRLVAETAARQKMIAGAGTLLAFVLLFLLFRAIM